MPPGLPPPIFSASGSFFHKMLARSVQRCYYRGIITPMGVMRFHVETRERIIYKEENT